MLPDELTGAALEETSKSLGRSFVRAGIPAASACR